ncbi:phosphoadenosine phosphosulfate reductase family protein [Altibacter lentus]|jgi:3'-phosphoadenosine 5'-phosphosulfate sulfotransferase (PAPS reductase)/FAD synthetase|uniref:phosphoadenosine phosphosulfate reductase family protein n=1 Tax=Altibacter lentus TaxID=1223410 RepID=UPI00055535E2|nr:phosphoadenosine phosphosulfate reductase family protein [Altibacter lentus]MCT8339010.1 phosphoadenosine phosphosulfate reductase family protein [Thermobacterium salinum]
MKVKHVLGISGGKDSAALALYLKNLYPTLDVDYYSCDTGKELKETYELIEALNSRLGKDIKTIFAVEPEKETPYKTTFDHFLAEYGGYLPSSTARWCTKKLKLEPFEKYIGDEPTISYVGIRGDENREGYISKKTNVQSIFPFRKNIWSEDVIKEVLANNNIPKIAKLYNSLSPDHLKEDIINRVNQPISPNFRQGQKLEFLLNSDVKLFNRVVFEYLKENTDYPVGLLEEFPLIDNDEVLVLDDIFKILDESGVGIPAYYIKKSYQVEIDGKIETGTYSRSRSGCFFCFYQQKIEWVWLLENHPTLFKKAMVYEKDGYNWMDSETLEELSKPERVKAIKKEHFTRMKRQLSKRTTNSWKDEIIEAEGLGCASCFI